MSEIETLKVMASAGAGVLIGAYGMRLMYQITTDTLVTLKELVANNTEAINELREITAKLCEKLNHVDT